MTAVSGDAPSQVLSVYRDRVAASGSRYDELLSTDGINPASAGLAERIEDLGATALRSRKALARRHLQDDGVTYGTSGPGAPRAGRWPLDPLPVVLDGAQWSALAIGLEQRAHLLDLILRDLYGPRRLIAERVFPGAAVFGHPGFIPQADGTVPTDRRALVLPSTDLVRDADGAWRVLGDRAQAPSGAGYAMADRRIVARTMPKLYRDTDLARLRGFFDDVRLAMHDAARRVDGTPRVVLLSPGPLSETAFDQAFLAALLGFPLVQAEDLMMRDGKVWARTTGREERVDVILRRVDSAWSDSLDLRSDSRLGVPGLIEAVRTGAVSVVNPVGAGALENPALVPYLNDACRMLLGEDLRLPGLRTWWCGDPEQAREGLERLPELVLKQAGERSRFGWDLSSAELDAVRADIAAEPWRWSLQESAPMSTVPVITSDGLAPRRFVLRAFGVGLQDEFRFMPGGLGRVATDDTTRMVSNVVGGQAKDVWVLSGDGVTPAPGEQDAFSSTLLPGMDLRQLPVSPRAAEDLFWLGRYAERAETGTRLLLVADDLVADTMGRSGSPGAAATDVLLEAIWSVTTVRPSQEVEEHEPGRFDTAAVTEHLRTLLQSADRVGTVAYAIGRVVDTAQAARELLSVDTWLVLGRLEEIVQQEDYDGGLQPTITQLLQSLIALSGLSAESLVRDLIWAFLDSGRRIERAQQTVALLRHTLAAERSPINDGQVIEAVLRATDSLITHRRRVGAGHDPASPAGVAVDLLVQDTTNPRSIAYQLERMVTTLNQAPEASVNDELEELVTLVGEFNIEDGLLHGRAGLRQLLGELDQRLRRLSDRIDATHFARRATQQALPGAGLADPQRRPYV